ncbi:glycosyltransferase family 39 protein [Hymenobacter sp. BT491]|uniref:glycosyltransferase family 39 protein n=1 Tax=Hymenobacter sp. BT491 TaxID=2766779 RepID=UPI0016536F53|nr:glycosyltransferase family 39 protein [Hymenobacter sp. BT491]MBC6989895.1 glycosyltransferase family 39 protein [Hymenobacter sp. BT491]
MKESILPPLDKKTILKPVSQGTSINKWEYLLLGAAVASLLLSCVIISSKKYYWNDELFSYYMTSEPSLGRMLAAFHDKLNNTPLLYFLLGWGWDKLFGSAELSLRLFSSLGMAAALLLTWATLRRTYALWATATGTLLVFCTSKVILNQNADARMYGLFLALSALAILFYDTYYRNQKLSNKQLLLNFCVHAAIIHTHLFGGFYSAAILLAFIITDRLLNIYRPKLYLSILLSWITFVFYLPSFLIQADAGKPRTWLPKPNYLDLLSIYNIKNARFIDKYFLIGFVMIIAFFLLLQITKSKATFIRNLKINYSELPILVIGSILILVPFAIWVISLTIKPIFYDRYMIPSSLGWVIFIAFIFSKIPPVQAGISKERTFSIISIISLIFICLLIIHPLSKAYSFRKQNRPGAADMTSEIGRKYASLPKVVTSAGGFLEHNFYAPDRLNYFFILDWEAAIDPNSGNFPPQGYKHMEAWKRNFPQFFQHNVVSSEDFLSKHDRFLVLDYPDYLKKCPVDRPDNRLIFLQEKEDIDCPQWVELRLLKNKNYKVTFLSNKNWYSILLVEKLKSPNQ